MRPMCVDRGYMFTGTPRVVCGPSGGVIVSCEGFRLGEEVKKGTQPILYLDPERGWSPAFPSDLFPDEERALRGLSEVIGSMNFLGKSPLQVCIAFNNSWRNGAEAKAFIDAIALLGPQT